MAYETLHDLLILKLCALYDVERNIIKALPKMAKAATDMKLSAAFTQHLEESEKHAERLEQAAQNLDFKLKAERSEAIRGLIDDAAWCIRAVKDPRARDVILIASAQYIEHFEIAGYGTARQWAEEMGHSEVADLLQKTLDEESGANEKLNDLALGGINKKANDMPAS